MAGHKLASVMLTVSDVARQLNVHVNTVRRWSNQGIIRAYRIGTRGDRRFKQKDISRLLEQFRLNRETPDG